MARAAPIPPAQGIFDIEMPGSWVLPDDQLWLALVKPPYTGPEVIVNDATRPAALALAQRLFGQNQNGQYPIALSAPERSAVILFPEFAFGSGDFSQLDALVRAQPTRTIVLAGFGAVPGDTLRASIQDSQFQCGWAAGIEAIDSTKRYNGAWCWIHDPRREGEDAHRCFVLLKNWPEQRNERVGIPDIAGGSEIIRLVADDCTIYPLICSDALCAAQNSAQERIASSIAASNLDRNNVLVPVMMLDPKPAHPAWSSRLAHLIQAAPLKVAVVTCNHVAVAPLIGEDEDQLRCLSGALVSVQQFSPAHRETPPTVRLVNVAGMAGYVLRSPEPGIASGDFIWRELGLVNRFIWLPNARATCSENGISDEIPEPVQIEMQRWCSRVRRPAWLPQGTPGMTFLDAGLGRMRSALREAATAKAIWPEAFTGRGLDKSFSHHLDHAGRTDAVRHALDEIFVIASAAFQSPGYLFEPLTNPGHFHRPGVGDRGARDIIVWSAPEKLPNYQFQILQEAALNGRFARATVVVANGPGGIPHGFTRVTPDSTTDVGNGPPPNDASDIAEPPLPAVFWMPSGELHLLLSSERWVQISEDQRLAAIGLAVENLLNRVAA